MKLKCMLEAQNLYHMLNFLKAMYVCVSIYAYVCVYVCTYIYHLHLIQMAHLFLLIVCDILYECLKVYNILYFSL